MKMADGTIKIGVDLDSSSLQKKLSNILNTSQTSLVGINKNLSNSFSNIIKQSSTMSAISVGAVLKVISTLSKLIGYKEKANDIYDSAKNYVTEYELRIARIGEEAGTLGLKFQETMGKAKVTQENITSWLNLKQAIADTKTPSDELAVAQERLKTVESWFFENYGSLISNEEQKNGIRRETVNLISQQIGQMSEMYRLRLEDNLLEIKNEVPVLQEEIKAREESNKTLQQQTIEALNTSIALQEIKNKWEEYIKVNENATLETDDYLYSLAQSASTASGDFSILANGLTGVDNKLTELDSNIDSNSKKIDKNNNFIEIGTKSLKAYSQGAELLIQTKLGDTFSDAAMKVELLTKAQNEANTEGKILPDTMKQLVSIFPELAQNENILVAISEKMDTLRTSTDEAKNIADRLGFEISQLPQFKDIYVRVHVEGQDNIPQFSNGTRHAYKGPAIVNERGRELIEGRDGSFRYVDSDSAALTFLNAGDKVYTAAQTRHILGARSFRIPGFAGGLGVTGASAVQAFSINGTFKTKFGNLGKEIVASLADGITKNEALVEKAMNVLGDTMLAAEAEYDARKKEIEKERALEEEAEAREEYFKRRAEAEDRVELAEI